MAEKFNEAGALTPPREATPAWMKALAWAFVGGLLLMVALRLRTAQLGPVAGGEPAPPFVLTTFEGEQINSEDLRGRVVLLNFWASWCLPCEDEAPELEAAWNYYQGRDDVIFIGVDWADTEREALAFLEEFGVTYPNGPDLGTRMGQDFRILGVPETYIIDREGTLSFVKAGPFQSMEEIITVVDRALAR
jgi:cytochrome c biogenesis protein CcmG/thiol:disulfide interchange protein DsbE